MRNDGSSTAAITYMSLPKLLSLTDVSHCLGWVALINVPENLRSREARRVLTTGLQYFARSFILASDNMRL